MIVNNKWVQKDCSDCLIWRTICSEAWIWSFCVKIVSVYEFVPNDCQRRPSCPGKHSAIMCSREIYFCGSHSPSLSATFLSANITTKTLPLVDLGAIMAATALVFYFYGDHSPSLSATMATIVFPLVDLGGILATISLEKFTLMAFTALPLVLPWQP